MTQLVHVAVGVIVGSDGRILIAKRPQNTHQGGLWEFPGGKVAAGETVQEALVRELHEELAIDVQTTEPLIQIRHDYGDKAVLLDVHKITAFNGTACGNEGQPIVWVESADLNHYEFPAANRAIISALLLPDRLLITGAANSHRDYLQRTENALVRGIRLVQLRCPDMPAEDYKHLAQAMQALVTKYRAVLLLNTSPTQHSVLASSSSSLSSTGLHLNRRCLAALANQELSADVLKRPVVKNILLGASCHNAEEIAQARVLGVDFITLSPVAQTSSHPGAEVLGWDSFRQLAAQAGMPVFALGGMSETDIPAARLHGAQGVAAISCWW